MFEFREPLMLLLSCRNDYIIPGSQSFIGHGHRAAASPTGSKGHPLPAPPPSCRTGHLRRSSIVLSLPESEVITFPQPLPLSDHTHPIVILPGMYVHVCMATFTRCLNITTYIIHSCYIVYRYHLPSFVSLTITPPPLPLPPPSLYSLRPLSYKRPHPQAWNRQRDAMSKSTSVPVRKRAARWRSRKAPVLVASGDCKVRTTAFSLAYLCVKHVGPISLQWVDSFDVVWDESDRLSSSCKLHLTDIFQLACKMLAAA